MTLSSTAAETAIVQCTSCWALVRGHRLNTSIVLAVVHSLSGLFRTVSAVKPSLCHPLPTLSLSLIGHLASVDGKQHESKAKNDEQKQNDDDNNKGDFDVTLTGGFLYHPFSTQGGRPEGLAKNSHTHIYTCTRAHTDDTHTDNTHTQTIHTHTHTRTQHTHTTHTHSNVQTGVGCVGEGRQTDRAMKKEFRNCHRTGESLGWFLKRGRKITALEHWRQVVPNREAIMKNKKLLPNVCQ